MFIKTNKLYCFSPPAMLATFAIEVGLAIYVLVRYKMSLIVRLATAILLLLAIFQLAEYSVCGRTSTLALVWSRIGYVAITLLPPLTLHLIFVITKHRATLLKTIAYCTSLLFIATFVFSSTAFSG